MSAVVAATSAVSVANVALQSARPPALATSRIAFRSVLLLREASPLRPSTEPQKSLPRWPEPPGVPGAGTARRSSTEDLNGAQSLRLRHEPGDDPLDPLERRRAALAPPDLPAASVPLPSPDPRSVTTDPRDAASSARAASLEELVPALVRRIAWSGDRHRGAMRLELGAGELAGGTLLVQAEGGRVRVRLDAPPGTDVARWRQRISDRLALRGVQADSVEVT